MLPRGWSSDFPAPTDDPPPPNDATHVEMIRDYIAPDGQIVRVTAQVHKETLSYPLGRTAIERDFELVRDVKIKRLTPCPTTS